MSGPRKTRKALLTKGIAITALLGVAGFFTLTSPWAWSLIHPSRDVADSGPADLKNGRDVFVASDCATCHATPNQPDHLKLGGGRVLDTEFGKFRMPNISSDPKDGIGGWTLAQFTRAVREGVGPAKFLPDGQNLYPSFPYTSYQRLSANDVRDMFAFMKTLPAVAGKVPDHELKFPYNIRRGIGVWRLAFLDGKPLDDNAAQAGKTGAPLSQADLVARGRYLVEGAGHCAECHSPRNFMGVIADAKRYGGGQAPDGKSFFPNISQHDTGINFWAEASIVSYLKTGISPLGKTAGGDMAEVIANTKQLPDRDLKAIAAYLKTLPGVDNPAPGQPSPNYTAKVVTIPVQKNEVPLPTSTAADIAKSPVLFTTATKPLYLDQAAMRDATKSSGKLLGAAKLMVEERQGDRIKVRLDGWQPEGVTSVVYAARGKRIVAAVLDEDAIAKVERGAFETDKDSGARWAQVKASIWIDSAGLNVKQENLWQFSSNLLSSSCSTCHSLNTPEHFTANQWIGTLGAMRRYTSLSNDEYRLLLAYVQNHAKDMGGHH
ncbi:c-type cytochrome [Tardiphaga alba]|uniref:C-type cytochrome n=1 Tax=Tardiphaga alba TaxID=340268 RepID=A0ABX8AE41_9BRAD|nr:c-type cytochrome [Tardiphaga alba]QUS40085.1 c-type cytochrome [Tardiphaga alba]